MRFYLFALLALGLAAPAAAQTVPTAVAGQKIAWDSDFVNVAKFQTAIDINVLDATAPGWTDNGIVAWYALPSTLTSAKHTFAVRACNVLGKCSPAVTFDFQFGAGVPVPDPLAPKAPTNVRLLPPGA